MVNALSRAKDASVDSEVRHLPHGVPSGITLPVALPTIASALPRRSGGAAVAVGIAFACTS